MRIWRIAASTLLNVKWIIFYRFLLWPVLTGQYYLRSEERQTKKRFFFFSSFFFFLSFVRYWTGSAAVDLNQTRFLAVAGTWTACIDQTGGPESISYTQAASLRNDALYYKRVTRECPPMSEGCQAYQYSWIYVVITSKVCKES